MIKAIVLDVDGTITDEKRRLDVAAVSPVRKAEREGIPVCLATGNVLCFARTTAILLGTTGPLTAEDGGIVYDQDTNEEHMLGDTEEADEGIRILEEEFDNIEHTSDFHLQQTYRTLEPTIDVKKATEVMQKQGLRLKAVNSGFSIHVRDPDINKGKALEKMASILGCSVSEMAAIGDAENDLEMLKKAEISFVPANAIEKAKEISTHTMKGKHGRGVKEAIDYILKNLNH